MDGLSQLVIDKLHVEADKDDIRVVIVRDMDAVIDELVAQGGRSDEIDLFPLVVFIEEKCGRHTGSEHVVLLAGEAEGELALDIVAAAAAGVVGQIGVALTVTRQALYKLSGSFENIGPDPFLFDIGPC